MSLLHPPRVVAPASVAAGEVFQVKTLIGHSMETGLRYSPDGTVIPRNIINRFVCRYDGKVAFSVDLHEAVAANPFFEFYLRATKSGVLEFEWSEDGGAVYTLARDLVVT
jgi:sulfur-oxidizing protein SoxZ